MAKAKKAVKRASKGRSGGGFDTPPDQESSQGMPLRFVVVGALAVAAYLAYSFFSRAGSGGGEPAPPSAPAAPVAARSAEYGAKLDLDADSGSSMPEDLLDIKFDPDGSLYVLTQGHIHHYKDGKKLKTLEIGGAGNRGWAYDGANFYCTHFDFSAVQVVPKSLDKITRFNVEGVQRLLGIAYNPSDKSLVLADVQGKSFFVVDTQGRKKGRYAGPNPVAGPDGYMIDLQLGADGNYYTLDAFAGKISVLSPQFKMLRAFPIPWGGTRREHLAVHKGLIYAACFNEQRVLVMDTEGRPVGHAKEKEPLLVVNGPEGSLYLVAGGELKKIKPVSKSAAAAAPAEPAAEPVSGAAKP